MKTSEPVLEELFNGKEYKQGDNCPNCKSCKLIPNDEHDELICDGCGSSIEDCGCDTEEEEEE